MLPAVEVFKAGAEALYLQPDCGRDGELPGYTFNAGAEALYLQLCDQWKTPELCRLSMPVQRLRICNKDLHPTPSEPVLSMPVQRLRICN